MKDNKEALEAFMGINADVMSNIAELKEFVENHMEYNPEEITWSHVGSANYILKQLEEIIAFKRGV